MPRQTKVVIIGVLPDSIKNEKLNPKSIIKVEIKTKILFRPNLSAKTAETGMPTTKNKIENN
jgi:hypothetical protein